MLIVLGLSLELKTHFAQIIDHISQRVFEITPVAPALTFLWYTTLRL